MDSITITQQIKNRFQYYRSERNEINPRNSFSDIQSNIIHSSGKNDQMAWDIDPEDVAVLEKVCL